MHVVRKSQKVANDDIQQDLRECLKRMSEEWRRSVPVPIFKNKGDVQSCGGYREMNLLSYMVKERSRRSLTEDRCEHL